MITSILTKYSQSTCMKIDGWTNVVSFVINTHIWTQTLCQTCLITIPEIHVIARPKQPPFAWAFHSAYLSGQIIKMALRLMRCCIHFNTRSQQSIKAAHLLEMLNTQGSQQGQVKERLAAVESQAWTDRVWYYSWLLCCSIGIVIYLWTRLHSKCVTIHQSVLSEDIRQNLEVSGDVIPTGSPEEKSYQTLPVIAMQGFLVLDLCWKMFWFVLTHTNSHQEDI